MKYSFNQTFAEEITKENKQRKFFSHVEKSNPYSTLARFLFFVIIFVFGIGTLLLRLFQLTIMEGDNYKVLAEENRIKEEKIPAPRGIIYDRNDQPLVRNIPDYDVDGNPNKPAEDKDSVGLSSVAREYIYSSIFSHVLGYTGEVTEDDVISIHLLPGSSHSEAIAYDPGDIIGKMGLEQSYDHILRGKDGKELFEVDALGNKIRTLGKLDPIDGNNLKVSLDKEIQEAAALAMEERKGAVVVSDPKTGEILALYSSPSFDPNLFIRNVGIDDVLASDDQPLFNRAISGIYPPGSTFKMITAISGLETGKLDQNTTIEDKGILEVGDYSYANWYFTQYGKTDGIVDVVKALYRSNDIFFYKAGEMIGIADIALWARKLGLENLTGVDIQGEEKGLMPDPEWRESQKGEKWYLGNTYHVAIGQGDILTTPLQINSLTNIIAADGFKCSPTLVISDNRRHIQCQDMGISDKSLSLVKEGMQKACQAGGTGFPLFNFTIASETLETDGMRYLQSPSSTVSAQRNVEVTTACKTGTAEFGDLQNKTHAWFTVYAPAVDPEISVTVLVEAGGEGSRVAAPIAKDILTVWFEKK